MEARAEPTADRGLSRAEVILEGALAAGAAFGLGLIAPYVQRAMAAPLAEPSAGKEIDALNLVLSFEYLQSTFYEEAKRRLRPSGQLGALIETLAGEEQEHLEAVRTAIEELGGEPDAKGDYAFAYSKVSTFLRLGQELETVGIAAYNGAIPSIESERARSLAASIAQVEGRHAAGLALQRGEEAAPEAFDTGRTAFQARLSVVRFTGEY